MQVSIGWALGQELVGLLDSELAYVQNDFVSVTPSNEYLIASLLSAVAIKLSLCRSNALFHAIHRGLHYNEDPYRSDSESDLAANEVAILGMCLQFCMSGSYI